MKLGDAVMVKLTHHARPGWIGIIVADFATSTRNKGKAFKIQFTDGMIRTAMVSNLEVITCS